MTCSTGTERRKVGQTALTTRVWWRDGDGYVDLSGYTAAPTVTVTDLDGVEQFAKTSGLTLQAGDVDTPSLIVAWQDSDLGQLPAGYYTARLETTVAGRTHVAAWQIILED